jgi:antitoxin PrlF
MTSKGQITVPKAMRDAFGWKPGTKLAFVREKDGVKIVALMDEDPGAALVRRSRGIAATGMSTDEIMQLTRGED